MGHGAVVLLGVHAHADCRGLHGADADGEAPRLTSGLAVYGLLSLVLLEHDEGRDGAGAHGDRLYVHDS